MISHLGQLRRSIGLDHRRGRTDLPVVVQVLLEAGLERFERKGISRHKADI